MFSPLSLDREDKDSRRWSQADSFTSLSDASRLTELPHNGNDGSSYPMRELCAFWSDFEDSSAANPIKAPPQAIDGNLHTISNALFIPRAPQDSPDSPDTPDTPDSPDISGSVESPEISEIPEDSERTRPPPPPSPTETPTDPGSPITTRPPNSPVNNPGSPDPPDTTGGSDPPPDTSKRPNPPPKNTNPPSSSLTAASSPTAASSLTAASSPTAASRPTAASSLTAAFSISSESSLFDSSISSTLSSSSNDPLQDWSATPGSPSPSTTSDGENSETPPGNDRLNTGAIIGAVVAGVMICAIVAGCLLWRRRRRMREAPHLVAFSSTGGAGTAMQDGDVERGAERGNISDPLAVQEANDTNRLSRSYSDLDLDLDLNEKERFSQLFAFPSQGLGHHRASASEASLAEISTFVHAPSSVVGRRRDSATLTAIVSDTDTPRQVQSPTPHPSDFQSSSVPAFSNATLPQDASSALAQSLNEADLNRIAAVVSKMLSSDPESARAYVVTIRGEDSRTGAAAQDGMGVGCRVEAPRVPPPPYGTW